MRRIAVLLSLLFCAFVNAQVSIPLTPESIGRRIYERSAGEIAAGVLPTFYRYAVGNVQRYGAVCDAVADDTAEIAQALASSLYVWVPDGLNCLLSASLLPRSGTTFELRGNARLISSVRAWNSDGLIKLTGGVTDITIRGGIYDGNKAANPTGTAHGIDMRDCSHVRIEGAHFKDFPASALSGGSGGDGIYMGRTTNGCNDVVITNNTFTTNVRQGISVVAGVGVRILGNSFIGMTGSVSGPGGGPGGGIDLEANSVADPLRDISITGNYFLDNFFGVIAQQFSFDVAITGNTFRASRRNDILLSGVTGFTVSGNVVQAGSSDGTGVLVDVIQASNGVISNNTLIGVGDASANEGPGIRLTQTVDNVSIVGNYIATTRTQGIIIGSSAMGANISNVLVSNNTLFNVVGPSVAANTAAIGVSGNNTGGFYPSRLTITGNQIVDTRTAGSEVDVAIGVSSNIPAATQATYRIVGNRISGAASDYTSGTARPGCVRITFDPPSLSINEAETSTAGTILGAVLGDLVDVYPSINLQGTQATGYVTAADTVEIMIENPNPAGASINLANSTYTACLRRANAL